MSISALGEINSNFSVELEYASTIEDNDSSAQEDSFEKNDQQPVEQTVRLREEGLRRLRTETQPRINLNTNSELTDVLIKYGNEKYSSPLQAAITEKDIPAIKILLKNQFNPNEKGCYPLTTALWTRNLEIVQILLDYDADPMNFDGQDDGLNICGSSMYEAIAKYIFCNTSDDEALFYRTVINMFLEKHPDLQKQIVSYQNKKFNILQFCLNLSFFNSKFNGKEALKEIQKKRAAELATLFIKHGAHP